MVHEGLISIIIPLYNGEKYISKCLNSIFEQTYKKYEIILAYDTKSNDNTYETIINCAKKHDIVIDVNCDASTGAARNRGLKRALGEYVIFMDADDELMPDYLERFITVFTQNPELNAVHCNYVHCNEKNIDKARDIAKNSDQDIVIYSRDDALYAIMLKFSGGSEPFSGSPWTWMVKMKYLEEMNFAFPNYSYGDETVYAWKMIGNSNFVGVSLKKTYLWIQHTCSITTNYFANSSWVKRDQMRADISSFLRNEVSEDIAQDYDTMQLRDLAFIFALAFDKYSGFKSELSNYNIKKLSTLMKNEPIIGYPTVWCFNISKYLFYKLARFVSHSKRYNHLFGRI